ncbi:L,D-transpeptidase [Sulfobacillus harzensis]|uniref:L,D-transpeptidase n=1 Tax=Sulfobacillus harzensis TaxID=2729629 RepID=A0A7Y0L2K2_9FIRM|nr:L,D-transpeptidase [Sulfobacillus harzensis]NMP22116.1 L,D-transpeptidase [Sulfobacillus harzensis]
MNNQARLLWITLSALALLTISLSHPGPPHGDPAAMTAMEVRLGPVPHRVGIKEPVNLTTSRAVSADWVTRHLIISPATAVRVVAHGPHHFLIMPNPGWPEKSQVAIRIRGTATAEQLSIDDGRALVVNLSTQTLTAWENGHAVRTMAVSTGVAPRWSTPTGTFWIYRRVEDDHMVGGDPHSPDHWDVEHVPYAQYFNGAIAFHGAWWNHRFGRAVSHGCVQLPTATGPHGATGEPPEAEWLWHFADIGTPVIVEGQTPQPQSVSARAPLPYPAPPNGSGPTSAKSSAS